MKKIVSTVMVILLFAGAHAQSVLKGIVKDSLTGAPVSSASVFINKTQNGTLTDNSGNFSLRSIPQQRIVLVVSCVNYETQVLNIIPGNTVPNIDVKLKQRSIGLEDVVVRSFDKNGWSKWGKVFTENLIGIGYMAEQCKILNKEKIRFAYDKNNNILTAYASEPLMISNKYLGYLLTYNLTSFSINFKSGVVSYLGYPFFKDLADREKKLKYFNKHRKYAYEGSMMQFIRSLYDNTVFERKYKMGLIEHQPNKEKEKVKALYELQAFRLSADLFPAEVIAAYRKKLEEPDSLYYLQDIISASAVISKVDSLSAIFHFDGLMKVSYADKKEIYKSVSSGKPEIRKEKPESDLNLLEVNYVIIYPDGSYYNPLSLIVNGYWGWSEKLFNLLPTDYKEPD